MVEFDKTLESLCKVVNECYEVVFPGLPQYPKFSFTRVMTILWKEKVYSKIESNLNEALVTLLQKQRQSEIKLGEIKTKKSKKDSQHGATAAAASTENAIASIEDVTDTAAAELPIEGDFMQDEAGLCENKEVELIERYVQAVADLSVNELTIHYMGSTKATLSGPYEKLNKTILKQTK